MSAPNSAAPVIVNVLLVDGRKLMREGIAMLLDRERNISVVGEAEDIAAGARLVGPLGAHVVLLILPSTAAALIRGVVEADLAVSSVRELIAARPNVRVLILASGLRSPDLRQLIRAGAVACLTMDCSSEELVAAVRHAAAGGEVFLSAKLREQVARRYVNSAGPDGDDVASGAESSSASSSSLLSSSTSALGETPLAARETQVLRLIAAGQSTKEIAATLQVGTKTVETHRRRVMEKLNRHSVAELTQYAILKGLIQLPREAET